MKEWIQNNKGIYLPNVNTKEVNNTFQLELPDDIMYFDTNSKPYDKPLKIMFENKENSIFRTEKYKLTLKEVLKDILCCNYQLRKTLTIQQIHTEKGKLRKGRYEEVVNFLIKRGFTKEYINNEISQERERMVMTTTSWASFSNDIGVISL